MYIEYVLSGNIRVNNFFMINQIRKFCNNEKKANYGIYFSLTVLLS